MMSNSTEGDPCAAKDFRDGDVAGVGASSNPIHAHNLVNMRT